MQVAQQAERIETLNESDKQLKAAAEMKKNADEQRKKVEEQKKKNEEELQKERKIILSYKEETERKVQEEYNRATTAKHNAWDKERESEKKLKHAAELEEKQKSLIKRAVKKESKKIEERFSIFVWSLALYCILSTVCHGLSDKYYVSDLKNAGKAIETCWHWYTEHITATAASVTDILILYWVIELIVGIIVVALSVAVVAAIVRFVFLIFRDYAYDAITILFEVILVILTVFFTDYIQANVVYFSLVLQAIYLAMRYGIHQISNPYDKNIKDTLSEFIPKKFS